MTEDPEFSIITPSFRSSDWLKLCVASVADQGVSLEHIVHDSCSDDGTGDWLRQDCRVRAFIEKDSGMYDAINRGLRRAKGQILAYLNCDEQYLPGALSQVGEFLRNHPETEVVSANAVIVNAEGRYICDRRVSVPRKYHTWVSGNLSVVTASTFFRRSVISNRNLFFDSNLRVVGDVVWVLSLLNQNVPVAVLPHFTSVFTDTGANLSLDPGATRERRALLASAPPHARWARPLIIAHYRLRRLLAGHYRRHPPYSYAIYTRKSPGTRVQFDALNPAFRWRR